MGLWSPSSGHDIDHDHFAAADDRGDDGNDHLRQSYRPGRLAIGSVGYIEHHSLDGLILLLSAESDRCGPERECRVLGQ
jgi:hypothetical protein